MEIPGNDFKIKGRAIQDRVKVPSKESAKIGISGGTAGTQASDKITLSAKAKDNQKLLEAIRNSSDIRVDKVDKTKAAIADGSFHVDSHELAMRLFSYKIREFFSSIFFPSDKSKTEQMAKKQDNDNSPPDTIYPMW